MKILNTEKEDYHVHSLNFSDGWNTIDDIVRFAGSIGMKKIAFCDHSDAVLKKKGMAKKTLRETAKRWRNIHNNVEVIIGVEADLLNKKGEICTTIQGFENEFVILSYHPLVFKGSQADVVKGFINAIKKYHKRINIIGHVCFMLSESNSKKIIAAANKYKIPLELNAKYFLNNPEKWTVLLKHADRIYINCDGHLLEDIKYARRDAFKLLKKMKYIK